ncbi:transposase [Bacteroides nordii]|uniref:transposase n=1 Tax=Bacteroides nordii TaxID=291645 RepID=UPI003F7C4B05
MRKSPKNRVCYSDSFKMQVVQEALVANVNKSALCRKYSIGSPLLLYRWIRIFAPKPTLETSTMKSVSNKERDEILALKRQLQQQSLELKKEKMRADFYEEMVNVAEEMFNIPIRKKAGTKQ